MALVVKTTIQTHFLSCRKGKTTSYAYDSLNRLLSKTPEASFGQAPISFTYNSLGQRQTMTDVSGTTTYSYDNRNRLTSKATPQGTLTYTYDGASNLKTVRSSNANGVTVDYLYDALNRLATVKDNNLAAGSNTTSYSYDDVGNLSSYLYPNGVQTSYGYNSLNRLTSLTINKGVTPLASYAYTLGNAGNRTAVTELNGRQVDYTYDALYRLTSETISQDPHLASNGVISYTYDAVGNRLSRSSNVIAVPSTNNTTFDANDRLGSDVYDANGNTTSSAGSGYQYDFENRLIAVNVGMPSEVRYVYDGDGNRVSKTVGGVTTKYLVDSHNPTGYAQVVEEVVSGNVQRVYSYGLMRISQRQLIAGNWQVSFFEYDGHGSVRSLTDASGAVTDTYDYDAFGNLINRTGSTPNDYLYAGEQFDANLGFYYNRARYLNIGTGRFFTQDTFEGDKNGPASLHKYLYASDNPVTYKDPSGHFSLPEASLSNAIVGTLVGIGTLGYIRSAEERDGQPQLPSDESKTYVNYNAIKIFQSQLSADQIFDYIASFRGIRGSGTNVTGAPVTGAGQKLSFSLGFPFWLGQRDFDVRVTKFSRADRFMSVVTLNGHPLAGWRFWEVKELDNGLIYVRTGAVDSPARSNDYLKGFVGGNRQILQMWNFLLDNVVREAQGIPWLVDGDDYEKYGVWDVSKRSEFLQKVK